MLRKLILAGAAAVALVLPVLGTSKAQAGSFGFDIRYNRGNYGINGGHGNGQVGYGQRRHHHHFHVLYRDCSHDPWRCYGDYHSEWEARRVADTLRWRGFSTRISCD